MPNTRRATKIGLCPLCSRWFKVRADGRIQTHGPYIGRRVDSLKHYDQIPLSIDERRSFDSRHERGRTLTPQ